jgi:TatD DNase family protein
MYFDSHAHYDDESFDEDRQTLLEKTLKEGNVGCVINAAADINSSLRGIEFSKTYEYIYAAVGVHPHEVENMTEEDIRFLESLTKEKKVVAIGEIGLDYYYDLAPRDLQRKWFAAQLDLAKKVGLPVIIHSREACQETFDLLKEKQIEKGVIHCFSGSAELAKAYVKRGLYIGIGGALTFKNARKTLEVVEVIPLEKILIETDAPYLTPAPHRGKRNDSTYLQFVVEKIAEIKNISPEEVEIKTFENACRLFGLNF